MDVISEWRCNWCSRRWLEKDGNQSSYCPNCGGTCVGPAKAKEGALSKTLMKQGVVNKKD